MWGMASKRCATALSPCLLTAVCSCTCMIHILRQLENPLHANQLMQVCGKITGRYRCGQGVMGMCEWQKRRRIIITSFPANSGLIRCLVPHGREGQLMCTLFLSMRQ